MNHIRCSHNPYSESFTKIADRVGLLVVDELIDKWSDNVTDNPRTVVVNSDMTFVAFFKGTGVNENEGHLMVLYPNPANDYVRLEGIEANSEVRIYNAMGALVKVVNANANEEIGISELSDGLYLLRCGNATLRFVKK